jgi:GGDEF domain-containing protein
MNLDIGTIIAVMSGIQLLFAVLFALVSQHEGAAAGARQWAFSSLCVGVSFAGLVLVQRPMPALVVVALAALAGGGVGALYSGIEAFKGARPGPFVPLGLALLFVLQNYCLGALLHQEDLRMAANSIVFGLVYASCARTLRVATEKPLRTAYRLASAAFALFATLALLRGAALLLTPAGSSEFFHTEVHPLAFLIGSQVHMATSLALALLIMYRLADDLRRLASIDALTGLLNRRSFEQEGGRMLARAQRHGEPLSALMIDVDYFTATAWRATAARNFACCCPAPPKRRRPTWPSACASAMRT